MDDNYRGRPRCGCLYGSTLPLMSDCRKCRPYVICQADTLGGKASIESVRILSVGLFTYHDRALLIDAILLSRENGSNDNEGDYDSE
jgi:hypothetical protein